MDTIYLDNAATTFPKPESVYAEMDRVNRQMAVNTGRGSYSLARNAAVLVEETRDRMLKLVNGTDFYDVILTSSATIACNEIIGGLEYQKGETVYVSPYEHNAIMRPLYMMQQKYGFRMEELPLREETMEIDLEKTNYLFAKNPPTKLFVTHVSNVTGYVLPVQQLVTMAKEYQAVTVTDASQSVGMIPIDLRIWQADYVIFAGHKTLLGPFGIGGFYKRADVTLDTYLAGGTGTDSLNLSMPTDPVGRYEPASPNIVAIAGLHAALLEERMSYSEQEQELLMYLRTKIGQIEGIRTYLPPQECHAGIVSFNIEGYKAQEVGMLLDEDYHIAVRTGYHCAPLIHKYLKDERTLGVVRASIGPFTLKKEVDLLIKALQELLD